jgi:predicted Zn-ribbon and HTH transcriptional regulator
MNAEWDGECHDCGYALTQEDIDEEIGSCPECGSYNIVVEERN